MNSPGINNRLTLLIITTTSHKTTIYRTGYNSASTTRISLKSIEVGGELRIAPNCDYIIFIAIGGKHEFALSQAVNLSRTTLNNADTHLMSFNLLYLLVVILLALPRIALTSFRSVVNSEYRPIRSIAIDSRRRFLSVILRG